MAEYKMSFENMMLMCGVGPGDKARPHLTSDEVADQLHEHIVGKTIVITGVSPNSLGLEVARVIVKHNPRLVIIASRSSKAMSEAAGSLIKIGVPTDKIQSVVLDLGVQKSVRAAASKILKTTPSVDVLINNAGVSLLQQYQTTEEGIEMTIGINYFGHFLLTNLLMPGLLKSPAARIVNIGSSGHYCHEVRFGDINFQDGKIYDPYLAYAQSKSACMLFTTSLVQKLERKKIRAYMADPGSVLTGISRNVTLEQAVKMGFMLPDGKIKPGLKTSTMAEGVAGYMLAAFDPDLENQNGVCLTAGAVDSSLDRHVLDPELGKKLWALSEEVFGEKFDY